MIPLYTEKEFKKAKSRELLPLKCKQCGKTFHKTKNNIQQSINPKQNCTRDFCGSACEGQGRRHKQDTICSQCGIVFKTKASRSKNHPNHFCSANCFAVYRQSKRILLSCEQCEKTLNVVISRKPCAHHFCSRSCAGTYSDSHREKICPQCKSMFSIATSDAKKIKNKCFCSTPCAAIYESEHKAKRGARRSKLEIWLESRLISLYPTVAFCFNRKDAIGSELDIFVPELMIAFELNGPFHYEPIFGQETLDRTCANDNQKMAISRSMGIGLCVIDTSHPRSFKEKTSEPFLAIICNIINETLKIKQLALNNNQRP